MLLSTAKQMWTMSGALMNMLVCGFHMGYPTVLFQGLRENNSTIPLTIETESWIASSAAITTLLSFLLIAPIMEWYGRKIAHHIIVVPNILSFLVFYYAKDVTALLIARLLYGIPCGGTASLTPIIIGEYTSPEVRGIFLNAKTTSVSLGVAIAHLSGVYFDWRTAALVGLALSVPPLLITFTWPESPAWLARRGDYKGSKQSFHWLRGNNPDAQTEIHTLIQVESERRDTKMSEHIQKPFSTKIKKFLYMLLHKDFQKPVLITICVWIILQTCGREVFPAYAVEIISAFTNSPGSLYYVVGLDIFIFFSNVISCVMVNWFKRRTLLFFSGITCNVLLLSICLYLFLKSKNIVSTDNAWLPLTLLASYFVVTNVGTLPITLALLGEIYPLKYRSMGVVIIGIIYPTSLMLVLKLTPVMMETIDFYGTFFIFSICMILALLCLYFILPETKDKTLQQIEEHFTCAKVMTQVINDRAKDVMIGDEID